MQREQPHAIIPEKDIPPHKDHEYLRLTSAEEVVLRNKSPEDRGKWMREHMPTSEVLARWLESKNLKALGARARGSEFDLNRSKDVAPGAKLVSLLEEAGLMEEAEIVRGGAFDPTDAETEAWANGASCAPLRKLLQDMKEEDPMAARRRAINEGMRRGVTNVPVQAKAAEEVDLSAIKPGDLSILTAGDRRPISGTDLDMEVTDVREEDDGQGGTYPSLDAKVVPRVSEALRGPDEPCEPCEEPQGGSSGESVGTSDKTGRPQTGLNP